MRTKLLLSALLLVASTMTYAQQSANPAAQPALTPEQQAQLAQQNQQMAQAALQVAQLVDQDKIGDVWDGASIVAKDVVKKDVFVKKVAADRTKLGAVKARTASAVGRLQSDGKSIPSGQYFNVVFSTQFASVKQPVREMVSFHYDADRTWRVAGYTVR